MTSWPLACEAGCAAKPTALYLTPGFGLSFTAPGTAAQPAPPYDEYVSDPAKPVPYLPRPVRFSDADAWRRWLVSDQRATADRTDVLTYVTPPLSEAVRLSGAPVVHLLASTNGTDSDWVVKLIDVYPDEVPSQPELGGYQLAIALDIFRGRYRESFERPQPITPDNPLPYTVRAADRQSRLQTGSPHHGAGAVDVISALRPESADLRPEHHLFRQAGRLHQGHATCVTRGGSNELHRPARGGSGPGRSDALIQDELLLLYRGKFRRRVQRVLGTHR